MIKAGRMSYLVVVQRPQKGEADAMNRSEIAWIEAFRCKAERRDLSDAERFQNDRLSGLRSARFRFRRSHITKDVSPANRLIHDGRIWEIISVKELDDPLRRFLEVTAKAGERYVDT